MGVQEGPKSTKEGLEETSPIISSTLPTKIPGVKSEVPEEVTVEVSLDKPEVPKATTDAIEPPQTETQPGSPMELSKKLLAVFFISSALAIFLWFMAGAGFPWFIYIVYSVGLIDCFVYGIKQKNYFFLDWSTWASTNFMLLLTFLACGGGYPWFVIPLLSTAIIPVAHYIGIHYKGALRWLYIHAVIYLLINTMIFLIWVIDSLDHPFPWFIYPWSGWGVLILIQYNYAIMHDKAKCFVYICANIACMLLITFRFAIGPLFLVFVFVGVAIGITYYVFLKKGYVASCKCSRRSASPQPPQQPLPTEQLPLQHPLQQSPPLQHSIPPQNPSQPPLYPVYYQNAPQQPMYYQQTGAAPPQAYYAFYPPNQGIYPPLFNNQQHLSQSLPQPIPQPSGAILTTDSVNDSPVDDGENLLNKK